jgi:FtsP/CotA-like multicopper oxidase with cupredoxin domain
MPTTSQSGCTEHHLQTQVQFSTSQPHEGSPVTEFRQTPDKSFLRDFYNAKLDFPDGLRTEIWSFEDGVSGRRFPAPLTRANEGEIVHVKLKPSKKVHTIHHHGMEPDPRNDGVGHTSFEVTGEYTYQWRPQVGEPGNPNMGSAGSYFYHCHVNTVLHVQFGMFGPMVIDPPTGRGKAFIDDPVGYDVACESMLVPYAVDPRWHTLDHAAGLGGVDVGLNRFEPTNFYLLGGDLSTSPTKPPTKSTAVQICSRILARPPGQQPGLLRILDSQYFPLHVRFGGGLKAEVIAHDGRPFRDTSRTPSPPVSALTDVLVVGTAERYDMRLRPPAGARSGDSFPITVDFVHWITGKVVGTQTTRVDVV